MIEATLPGLEAPGARLGGYFREWECKKFEKHDRWQLTDGHTDACLHYDGAGLTWLCSTSFPDETTAKYWQRKFKALSDATPDQKPYNKAVEKLLEKAIHDC